MKYIIIAVLALIASVSFAQEEEVFDPRPLFSGQTFEYEGTRTGTVFRVTFTVFGDGYYKGNVTGGEYTYNHLMCRVPELVEEEQFRLSCARFSQQEPGAEEDVETRRVEFTLLDDGTYAIEDSANADWEIVKDDAQ